jgi:broad specificity phosphatase PhoE
MIYLVRHGQTEFNVARRAQGSLDSELTPTGVEQAGRMGRLLRDLTRGADPLRIIASPQGRAHRTARIIRDAIGLPLDVALDPRLREVGMGEWDGRDYAAIDAEQPGLTTSGGDWFFKAPGGERLEGMTARLAEWLVEARALPGVTIAVSHGVAGRIIRGLVTGMNPVEALVQPVPQDAVFRLKGDEAERIDCEPAAGV